MNQELVRRLRKLEAEYADKLVRERVITIGWATPSRPRGLWLRKEPEVVQGSDPDVVQDSSESSDPLIIDAGPVDEGPSLLEPLQSDPPP